jgi:hypothetical protein
MAKITQDDIDSSQLPSVFEYENRSDAETVMSVKSGFVLKTNDVLEYGDWRIRAVAGSLYVEHQVEGTWTEQGRFDL